MPHTSSPKVYKQAVPSDDHPLLKNRNPSCLLNSSVHISSEMDAVKGRWWRAVAGILSRYAAGIECIVAYPNSRTCASALRNDDRTCWHSAAALKNVGPRMLLPRKTERDRYLPRDSSGAFKRASPAPCVEHVGSVARGLSAAAHV